MRHWTNDGSLAEHLLFTGMGSIVNYPTSDIRVETRRPPNTSTTLGQHETSTGSISGVLWLPLITYRSGVNQLWCLVVPIDYTLYLELVWPDWGTRAEQYNVIKVLIKQTFTVGWATLSALWDKNPSLCQTNTVFYPVLSQNRASIVFVGYREYRSSTNKTYVEAGSTPAL